MEIPRLVSPATNPNGYMAAVGAVLAAAVMISNAVNHHGVIDTTVIVSAVGAVLALVSRQYVTPVSDPRDGNGNLLTAQGVLPPGAGAASPPHSPSLEAASPQLRQKIDEALRSQDPPAVS